MAAQEVLILAMSKMLSGICAAGFTRERHEVTGLRWVRPVRPRDTLLPGDMTDGQGRLVQCGDVVELDLLQACPDPPHVEDCRCDFVHRRPRLLRRLEGERRARFLAEHVDCSPEEVLVQAVRSLALVRPAQVWARFTWDRRSGSYEARLGFSLEDEAANNLRAASERGASATDLKWRALGRAWLGDEGGALTVEHDELMRRLGAEAIYLTVGLSRRYQGEHWPLVAGVHVVPDFEMEVAGDRL